MHPSQVGGTRLRNQSIPVILGGGLLLAILVWRWIYVEWSLFQANQSIDEAAAKVHLFYQKKQELENAGPAEIAAAVAYLESIDRQSTGNPALEQLVDRIREETIRDIFAKIPLPNDATKSRRR
jgi:hypothetical protein